MVMRKLIQSWEALKLTHLKVKFLMTHQLPKACSVKKLVRKLLLRLQEATSKFALQKSNNKILKNEQRGRLCCFLNLSSWYNSDMSSLFSPHKSYGMIL